MSDYDSHSSCFDFSDDNLGIHGEGFDTDTQATPITVEYPIDKNFYFIGNEIGIHIIEDYDDNSTQRFITKKNDLEFISNSTSKNEIVDYGSFADEMKKDLQILFVKFRSQLNEEEDIDSFYVNLDNFLKKDRKLSVKIFANMLLELQGKNIEIVCESIKYISLLDDDEIKGDIFRLLIIALNHKSPIIRSIAALGFVDFGDKNAISYLKHAYEKECFSSLREDYTQIIEELESM